METKKNTLEIIEKTIDNTLKTPTLEDYLKKKKIFSGNLDAKKISEIFSSYGINPIRTPKKKFLLEIKNKRNKIAHGEQSFKDACRNLTSKELKELKNATKETLLECINSANQFLTDRQHISA